MSNDAPSESLLKLKMGKSHVAKDPVTNYCNEHSTKQHPCQKKLMDLTMTHPWALMMGAREVVNLNCLLMQAIGAKKVLDVGVYTGYSALSAALTLPEDGKVIACEVNDTYIKIGMPLWEEAGVAHKIHVKLQSALKTLDELLDSGEQDTFDFAFVDADKENYKNYYDRCLKLVRKGGIIAVDNTLWSNTVIQENSSEISDTTRTIKEFNDYVANDNRVLISLINIGDGLTIITRKE